MTAYRQQALACAALLASGPYRPRDIKNVVPDGPKILLANVYGWFARIERGLYGLTVEGRAALTRWPQLLPFNRTNPKTLWLKPTRRFERVASLQVPQKVWRTISSGRGGSA